jgi:hypothetical protein
MTKAKFKATAEAAFRKANPGIDATITWAFTGPIVPYPAGGGTFRTGHFHVEAPGYRTRTMFASADTATGSVTVR